jgi:hypothetical protein
MQTISPVPARHQYSRTNHHGQIRLLARKHGSDFIDVHASYLEIQHYHIDGVLATIPVPASGAVRTP